MSKVVIGTEPQTVNAQGVPKAGKVRVEVDGVDLAGCLSSVVVRLEAHVREVVLELGYMREADIVIEGAALKLKGMELPTALRRALFEHLNSEFGPRMVEVTVLSDDVRAYALGESSR